jgi:cell division control protein 11
VHQELVRATYHISTCNNHSDYKISYSGRTTFVNTLCGKKVLQGKDADDATNAHVEEGVRIKPITVGRSSNQFASPEHKILILPTELELDEEGTRISLTIVDTPGFGDQIDNEARFGTALVN